MVRTVHMKLDLAKLQHRLVDILITDLAKYFDVIARTSTRSWEPVWAWERLTTSPPTPNASHIPCLWAPGNRVPDRRTRT